jgi:hypothetical protein
MEKCKAGALIFSYRSPHCGQAPEGLKGGKPAPSTGDALETLPRRCHQNQATKKRWSGYGMQKHVSYVFFFPFHLSSSLFPFVNLF